MYNNIKILILFLIFLILNYSGNNNELIVSGKEFRLTTFLNPYCEGIPSITLSSTTCSPDNYFQVINESMITNTNINSNSRNCNNQFSNTHTSDTFPINECITVDQDDKYSYSIIMTSNNETNPRSIEGYCNQFNFFDCDNYNIVSFKNGSCFIYDDYHIKQTCDDDFIYTFKCNHNNCLDSNCRLSKKEPNNVDNDCFKKSIKINELKSNNNTINKNKPLNNNNDNNNSEIINNEEKYNNSDNNNNNNNYNSSSINKINSSSQNNNNNQDISNRKQQMDHQTFERFNSSSKLYSNQILIIISIILNFSLIIAII